MSRIAVDVERLGDFVERLGRTQALLTAARDDADRRVRQVHSAWVGVAAQAQVAAHEQWRAGAAEVEEALRALQVAVRTARRNYEAAVLANRRMWQNA